MLYVCVSPKQDSHFTDLKYVWETRFTLVTLKEAPLWPTHHCVEANSSGCFFNRTNVHVWMKLPATFRSHSYKCLNILFYFSDLNAAIPCVCPWNSFGYVAVTCKNKIFFFSEATKEKNKIINTFHVLGIKKYIFDVHLGVYFREIH